MAIVERTRHHQRQIVVKISAIRETQVINAWAFGLLRVCVDTA
jgi:hypothetical protein